MEIILSNKQNYKKKYKIYPPGELVGKNRKVYPRFRT